MAATQAVSPAMQLRQSGVTRRHQQAASGAKAWRRNGGVNSENVSMAAAASSK